MTAAAPVSRQGLVASWAAQMIGTLVLFGAVMVFMKSLGKPLDLGASAWQRYAMWGILIGAVPALVYVRWYKEILDQDLRLERARGGAPDPQARRLLQKALLLGGAFCELPMAMGIVQLYFGGEQRWFFGATVLTIVLRLSYRPFTRTR